MGVFDSSIATAQRLVGKYGQAMQLVQLASVAGADPTKPWDNAAPTETSFPATGVKLDFKAREVDGERIQRGDQRVLIAASPTVPIPSTRDYLLISGARWNIVNVALLSPNGENILIDLQVRQ